MKMKHNKKRNTAFLYESLIKELTKFIVRKENIKKQALLEIIKKYFAHGLPLNKELELYNMVFQTKGLNKKLSQRYLYEIKKDFDSLDRKTIFNIQTNLINEINKSFSNSIFSNFVPNYKNIATVGQFFNTTGNNAKKRLIIEQNIINIMSSTKQKSQSEMKHIDNLTYKTFVKKFNESYDKSLHKEQKDLLTNYITSFSDNGLGLKSFLNEEIGRLKTQINECASNKKIIKNINYSENTRMILEKLINYRNQPITEQVVKEIFYIQDLVREVLK